MLAKEVKVNNLMRQRNFIKKALLARANAPDCDPSWSYIGQIFPENIDYFKEQGYKIDRFCSSQDLGLTLGKYIYVFNVSNDVKLSREEQKAAEAELVDCDEDDEIVDCDEDNELVDCGSDDDKIREILEVLAETLNEIVDKEASCREGSRSEDDKMISVLRIPSEDFSKYISEGVFGDFFSER